MESSESSSNLRNTVFNTINLINDLESGNSSQSSQKRDSSNQKSKNVSLSDNFVNGIKKKMLYSSKMSDIDNQNNSGYKVDNVSQLKNQIKSYLDSNLNSLNEVIKSQASQISDLKDEITILKKQLLNNSNSLDAQHSDSGVSELGFESNSGNNIEMTFDNPSPKPISSSDSRNEIINNRTDIPNNNYSQDSEMSNTGSVFSMYEENAKNTETNATNSLESSPVVNSNETEQSSNPRVGNYESGDVLIEKYFYCGNK